jgi:RNA polymerase sigma factor (TIGR02999 family)
VQRAAGSAGGKDSIDHLSFSGLFQVSYQGKRTTRQKLPAMAPKHRPAYDPRPMQVPDDVTGLIADWQRGDRAALEKLAPYVFEELHRVAESYMRRESRGNTLQTTALVNETYLKLAAAKLSVNDRGHFFALAARMMRRVLVDHARKKNAEKRGGNAQRVTLNDASAASIAIDELIEFDDALTKLGTFDARLAKGIELRYFGGLDYEETAKAMNISVTTLYEDLKLAKAWLKAEFG